MDGSTSPLSRLSETARLTMVTGALHRDTMLVGSIAGIERTTGMVVMELIGLGFRRATHGGVTGRVTCQLRSIGESQERLLGNTVDKNVTEVDQNSTHD